MVTEPFLPRQSSGVRPDKTTQRQGKGGPVSFLRVYENVDRDYVVTIAAGYLLNRHLAFDATHGANTKSWLLGDLENAAALPEFSSSLALATNHGPLVAQFHRLVDY